MDKSTWSRTLVLSLGEKYEARLTEAGTGCWLQVSRRAAPLRQFGPPGSVAGVLVFEDHVDNAVAASWAAASGAKLRALGNALERIDESPLANWDKTLLVPQAQSQPFDWCVLLSLPTRGDCRLQIDAQADNILAHAWGMIAELPRALPEAVAELRNLASGMLAETLPILKVLDKEDQARKPVKDMYVTARDVLSFTKDKGHGG